MDKTHEIIYEGGVTVVKFIMKPSFDQVKLIIDDISENYSYEKRLWDLSEIDFDFTTEEIRLIAEYGKRKFTKNNKLAVFATSDLAFGEMRQFEVYREEEISTPKVFRDKQNAINWLNE